MGVGSFGGLPRARITQKSWNEFPGGNADEFNPFLFRVIRGCTGYIRLYEADMLQKVLLRRPVSCELW